MKLLPGLQDCKPSLVSMKTFLVCRIFPETHFCGDRIVAIAADCYDFFLSFGKERKNSTKKKEKIAVIC